MHVLLFLLSHENCGGCYGKGNSQIVAKHGPQANSLTIQASLMKLGTCM